MGPLGVPTTHYAIALAAGAGAWLIANQWNSPHDSGGFHPQIIDWLFSHFPSLFASIFAFGIVLHLLKLLYYRQHNYVWYCSQFPNAFRNGKVRCRFCDSGYVKDRLLLQKTYTRVVYCGQCGSALYYTPEG